MLDKKRKSSFIEIKLIEEITNDIIKINSKCEILPLEVIDIDDVPIDNNITISFKNLYKKMYIGIQYDWLARFSKQIPGLELCIHKDDKAYEIIKAFGKVNLVDNGIIKYYILDRSNSSEDLINVFGYYNFPILDFSKLDMKSIAEEKGYLYIMNKTWFCHSPIKNEPCGLCNPCRYTIEEGMEYRLPQNALRRYRRDKKLRKFALYPYIRAIRRRILDVKKAKTII